MRMYDLSPKESQRVHINSGTAITGSSRTGNIASKNKLHAWKRTICSGHGG